MKNKESMGMSSVQKSSEMSQSRKKQDQQQKKKQILLRQLENELKHLDELDDEDFKDNQDPYINDGTLDRLQMISKQATKLEIKEIQKLCRLAIGKRILNIELKKKKDQHNTKLLKKEKIQLFFRQNRIKRYDYQSLIQQKLRDSTLIVRAYDNGKGFIQSDKLYKQKHQRALLQCDFMNTIKEVNKIFYSNYTGMTKSHSSTQILLKAVWIPIIIFLCLGITLPFVSFYQEEIILMSLLAIILLMLFYASIKTFKDKPNQNNQIEQSVTDVTNYFQVINSRFDLKGQNIEWKCSKDFMFLEVVFHNGFPS